MGQQVRSGKWFSECSFSGDRGDNVLDLTAASSPRSHCGGGFGFERGCLEAPMVRTLMS